MAGSRTAEPIIEKRPDLTSQCDMMKAQMQGNSNAVAVPPIPIDDRGLKSH